MLVAGGLAVVVWIVVVFVVVTVGEGTLGFGGTTGFCILEGFGGKGGRFWSPVACLLIGLYVAGECVSIIFSICCKHVLIDDKREVYCFGLEIMAIYTYI